MYGGYNASRSIISGGKRIDKPLRTSPEVHEVLKSCCSFLLFFFCSQQMWLFSPSFYDVGLMRTSSSRERWNWKHGEVFLNQEVKCEMPSPCGGVRGSELRDGGGKGPGQRQKQRYPSGNGVGGTLSCVHPRSALHLRGLVECPTRIYLRLLCFVFLKDSCLLGEQATLGVWTHSLFPFHLDFLPASPSLPRRMCGG